MQRNRTLSLSASGQLRAAPEAVGLGSFVAATAAFYPDPVGLLRLAVDKPRREHCPELLEVQASWLCL